MYGEKMGYIRFLGHSAFEVEVDGKRIYIDPWLGNPDSPLKVSDVDRADIVVVTHFHGDHAGDAEEIAKKTGAKIVAVYEIASYYEKKGLKAVGMNIGGPADVDGVKILFTPAAHSSEIGVPTGVIILGREAVIYHAGDTGLFSGMELYGRLYKIDYALVPIGGHFTMDPEQAALFVSTFKPRVAVPMHYGTFPVLYGSPDKFREYVRKYSPGTHVVVLRPGEKLEF